MNTIKIFKELLKLNNNKVNDNIKDLLETLDLTESSNTIENLKDYKSSENIHIHSLFINELLDIDNQELNHYIISKLIRDNSHNIAGKIQVQQNSPK